MNPLPTLHVVASVVDAHRGAREPEAVAVSRLHRDRNPAMNAFGFIMTGQNHQVSGSMTHDSKLLLRWRNATRVIAQDVVAPGKPFEVEVDGVRLRVEVREIVLDAAPAPVAEKQITEAHATALETRITALQRNAIARQRVRGQLAQHQQQLEYFVQRCEQALSTTSRFFSAATLLRQTARFRDKLEALSRPVRDLAEKALAGPIDAAREQELQVAAQQFMREGNEFCREVEARSVDTQRFRAPINQVHASMAATHPERLLSALAPYGVAVPPPEALAPLRAHYDQVEARVARAVTTVSKAFNVTQRRRDVVLAKLGELVAKVQATAAACLIGYPEAAAVQRALAQGDVYCHGRAVIQPVQNPDGSMRCWEVWFLNEGPNGWLGTAAFTRSGKNAGWGFESMSVAGKGVAAMQPIWAHQYYGVQPRAGEPIRLAVRGYGWIDVALPAPGEVVEVPLSRLTLERMDAQYHRPDYVQSKRREKANKVQFFDAGVPWNQPFHAHVLKYPFAKKPEASAAA